MSPHNRPVPFHFYSIKSISLNCGLPYCGLSYQDGPGTEPETETGTVLPGAEKGTGTAVPFFQEPKPESEPPLSVENSTEVRKERKITPKFSCIKFF